MKTYLIFVILVFNSIVCQALNPIVLNYTLLSGKSIPNKVITTTIRPPENHILINTNVTELESSNNYCFYYKACKPNSIEKCGHYIENCKPNHICYAIWNETMIILRGCMLDDKTHTNELCHDNTSEPHNPSKKNIRICFCRGIFCNDNMTYSAPPPLPSTPSPLAQVVRNSRNLRAHIFKVVMFSLVPIAICILLAVYLVYVWPRKHVSLPSGSIIEEDVKRTDDYVDPPHLQISLIEMISSGRYGKVWKGSCTDRVLAVKVFSDRTSWRKERDVYLIPQMSHSEFILKFISAEKKDCIMEIEYWLITEYHSKGSLSNHLKDHTLSWQEMLKLAVTCSKGLAYLHSQHGDKPCIVHRDFKSHNVLVRTDGTACICDFGLAEVFRCCNDAKNCKMQVGTRRYMPPEVLEGAIDFEFIDFCRIDVYALALVLWELLTRCEGPNGEVDVYKFPYTDEAGEHPILAKMHEVVVFNRTRPKIPSYFVNDKKAKKFLTVIDECWDHDCDARLSSSCVVAKLLRIINEDKLAHEKVVDTGDIVNMKTEELPLLKEYKSELNM